MPACAAIEILVIVAMVVLAVLLALEIFNISTTNREIVVEITLCRLAQQYKY